MEEVFRWGKALMPLDKYPFSERYGWVQDEYGVSWQLILTNPEGEERPFIIPSLFFVGNVCGKAEEAIKFYTSVFSNSKQGRIVRYPKGLEPNKEGTIMFSDFMLEKQWFAAMDSAQDHKFGFNEAISLIVKCANQKEIDYYWEKLSAVKESEECGWLKDKFGISWQVVPENIKELMESNPDKTTPALLKMKKIIIKDLEKVGKEKSGSYSSRRNCLSPDDPSQWEPRIGW
jgi:predicted 3-demethylubiquinone-9 3-methyltransferase (glyoxalase superfamily)